METYTVLMDYMIQFYQDFNSSQIDSYIHNYPIITETLLNREIDKISKAYMKMPRTIT